jgi:GTPase SAR1 family protein
VVYDITSKDSLNAAKKWIEELQERANPNIVITLAGNKVDLEEERQVTFEEGRELS